MFSVPSGSSDCRQSSLSLNLAHSEEDVRELQQDEHQMGTVASVLGSIRKGDMTFFINLNDLYF